MPTESRFMILLAWLVYVPLQIVWLPLSLAGRSGWPTSRSWVSRRLGLSQTAVEVANGRWTADLFGLRRIRHHGDWPGSCPTNSLPACSSRSFRC
jgi:hypothetical protein